MNSVQGTDARDMGEDGAGGELEPEIPVFKQAQAFVKPAPQVQDLAVKQHGMDGCEVARELPDAVERQVQHVPQRLALGPDQCHARIGGKALGLAAQHLDQTGNMAG